MAQEVAIELLNIKKFDVTTLGGNAESTPQRIELEPDGTQPTQISRGGYVGTNVKIKSTSPGFGDITVRVYSDVDKTVQFAETKFAFTAIGTSLSDLFSGPVAFFDGCFVTVAGSQANLECQILSYVQATSSNPF